MTMTLSIIIVNWNVWEDLQECLQSIYASNFLEEMEVILVDNASSDRSVENTQDAFPEVKIISNSINLGFSKANNQALAIAKGEFVLFLNPDTVLMQDTLFGCVSNIRSQKNIGLLGCKILYPDGSIQYECARNFPSLLSTLWSAFYLHMIFPKSEIFGEELMGYWDHMTSRDVPCLVGAFMLIRRSIALKLEGMDENVFMFLDDVDLCFRVKKEGWRIYYLADFELVHKSMKSQNILRLPMTSENATAKYEFFKKHYGLTAARICRLILLVQGVFRLMVSFVFLPIAFISPRLRKKLRNTHKTVVHWNLIKWVFRYRSFTRG